MLFKPSHKPEKAAFVELRKGIIEITAVENDRQPRSLVILTGLKTLFQTQLPMMPREYIARLVYDHNSKALAIIKRGYKVVGGICYRPFPHRGFAEIVFFATASVDQVKVGRGLIHHVYDYNFYDRATVVCSWTTSNNTSNIHTPM
jgi:histone acetyltransferase